MDYNQRKFKAVLNSDNGAVSSGMIFHYHQSEGILSCTYSGEHILYGQLLGLVDEHGNIDMRYHQINKNGEMMTGKCRSRPEVMPNGKIRLHEDWQWTSGDRSTGSSILEEV